MRLSSRALVLALLVAARADAQAVPDGPLSFAGGRVVLAGEITATASTASAGDEGWFNYSSYEHSTLRNLRIALSGEWRIARRVAFVGEVRADHLTVVTPYAAFVRIRPWQHRDIDVHVGRVPPTFGAFTRRPYSADNLVIGQPLAYQYLTSLRTDALPRQADDLAAMRGRGWAASYPVGRSGEAPGLPMVNALRWDTGVQVRARHGAVTWLASVTTGTLSNPRVGDDNRRPQLAARVTVAAGPAVVIGGSIARGPYLSRRVAGALPTNVTPEQHTQDAIGADIEVSHGRWLWRAEGLRSSWGIPTLSEPRLPASLAAWAAFTEGRVRLAPGLDLAGRLERLAFSEIVASRGTVPWDADVDRAEVAVGWTPRRRLTFKAAWQVNMRDGGLVPHEPGRSPPVHRLVLTLLVCAGVILLIDGTGHAGAQGRQTAGTLRGRLHVASPTTTDTRRPNLIDPAPAGAAEPAVHRPGVVYLEVAPQGAFEGGEPGRARLDQRNESFVPQVLAIRVGTVVDFPNNDRTYHNVFSLSRTRRFDLGRYAAGHSRAVRFDRPGIVRVFCDIHSHMNAFILVFSHPYFAVSGIDGSFDLGRIPAGTYQLAAWYDGAVRLTQPVTIASGVASIVNLELP